MVRFATCFIGMLGCCLGGCSRESSTSQPPPAPANLLNQVTRYDASVRNGKFCLKAGDLTLIFDRILIGDDGKNVIASGNFQVPQASPISGTNTLQFGSTRIEVTQQSGDDRTINVDINGYKLRLVDGGKALEIDGKSYRFDEPHTLSIDKDGKVTEKKD